MIYLIDRRYTIEGALDILVIQVKCPDAYKKCQCLGCKVVVEVEGNQGTCFSDDNVNDNQGTCFAYGNDNQGTCLASHEQSSFADGNDDDNQVTCFSDDNVNDNQGNCFAYGNDNQRTCLASHEQSSFADGNEDDNQGTCFADDKQESSLSEEDDKEWSKARDSPTKQRDKPCSQCGCG